MCGGENALLDAIFPAFGKFRRGINFANNGI
jgi:hypothetical protein